MRVQTKAGKAPAKRGIFISYRRSGGGNLARDLYNDLIRAGYPTPFWDIEEMASGDFREQLSKCIDEVDDVIIVLSKGSLNPRPEGTPDYMRMEIAQAIERGKNVIPYMAADFKWPKELPEDIAALPNFHGVVDNFEAHDFIFENRFRKLLRTQPEETGSKDGGTVGGGGIGLHRILIIAAAVLAVLAVCAGIFFGSMRAAKPQESPAGSGTAETVEEDGEEAWLKDLRASTQTEGGKHLLYNADGLLIADGFFAQDGKLIVDPGALYACRTLEYDAQGRLLTECFLNADLAPVNCSYGDARVEYSYDEKGNLVRQRFYGADGRPCMTADGFSEVAVSYDDQGRMTEKRFLDTQGKPCDTAYGLAAERYAYDAEGKMSATEQLKAAELD